MVVLRKQKISGRLFFFLPPILIIKIYIILIVPEWREEHAYVDR